ncbi:S8 family serine peptidase [Aerococcaceae bacterium NML171108]|nr:S8 family serine peptidase [Aerococcaceae bacterium NML171108]
MKRRSLKLKGSLMALTATALMLFKAPQVLAEATDANANEDAVTNHEVAEEIQATEPEATQSEGLEVVVPASEGNMPYNVLATLPSDSTAKVLSVESNAIINVEPVWNENYKGQGMVVAVIDSGLDIEHEVLRITNMDTAKYKNEEELNAVKEKAGINYGKWYNEKVVFGYNYADANDELKENDESSHGMHVSGTAVGNPSEVHSSGHKIYGVAPEAQLMFMRVFSDRLGPGTQDFLYSRAIRDAVKLGADSINLSLGGANGSTLEVGDALAKAVQFAREAGVSVVIAAGNDNVFGEGHSLPRADAPDYGVVANPAVVRDSIAVASYNNTHLTSEVFNVIGMEQNADFDHGNIVFTPPAAGDATFEQGVTFDYEYVGLGHEADFANRDLTGKIALIRRGEITFDTKIANATSHGAAGAIVFDNQPDGGTLSMSLQSELALAIPSVFISLEVGEELVRGVDQYKLRFDRRYITKRNPKSEQLSDFTSWGLSADGELKPDVSAPGGSIFSSINNNKYASMNGTSMAAPHVAGAVAILKQALLAQYPNLSNEELSARIKHLLMSTAVPHLNVETNAYTSPRQQGAGIIDVKRALDSSLYVTGLDNYSSIALGNVGDTLTFDVVLHNTSNQDKALKYIAHVNTDEVEEGYFTLRPRQLFATDASATLVVPANSTLKVPITLSAAQFADELAKLMPNGYFLEGFVRFLAADNDSDLVSIPFVGFRGAFQDLPVLEKPIYDMKADEQPFYYERDLATLSENEWPYDNEHHYTALVTNVAEFDPQTQSASNNNLIVLGTFEDEAGRYVLKRDAEGKVFFALSHNDDGNRDAILFKGVFLRNVNDLRISVYNDDDVKRERPLWQSGLLSGDKNFYSGSPQNAKSYLLTSEDTVWAGQDADGNPLPDGVYRYVLSYYSQTPGSQEQSYEFKVILDRVKPTVTTGLYDEPTRKFKPRTIVDDRTGIYRERVYYMDEQLARVYVARNDQGEYILPTHDQANQELALNRFWLEAEDGAGNVQVANVGTLVEVGNQSGIVTVKVVNATTEEASSVGHRYMIRNVATGEIVGESARLAEGHKLPFGEYDVTLFLYDTDEAVLMGSDVKRINLSETHSKLEVLFTVIPLSKATASILFDEAPPIGTRIYLVDQEGNRRELPRSRYNRRAFEKMMLLGDYQVVVELPQGYLTSDNHFAYSILENVRNTQLLTLAAKGNLSQGGAALTFELPTFDLAGDDDSDGYSNAEEIAKESDPFDSTSIPVYVDKGAGIIITLPNFDLEADTDGDGYANGEELLKGSDPFDRNSIPLHVRKGDGQTVDLPQFDLTLDADGDGYNNGEEHLKGSNPFDLASVPKETLQIQTETKPEQQKLSTEMAMARGSSATQPLAVAKTTSSSQQLPETGEVFTLWLWGYLSLISSMAIYSLGYKRKS